MGLKETVSSMRKHLEEMIRDLDKAVGGNKAASQRVRTSSIKFGKIAKTYRKESVSSEKGGAKKKSVKKAKKTTPTRAKKATAKLPKRR